MAVRLVVAEGMPTLAKFQPMSEVSPLATCTSEVGQNLGRPLCCTVGV